MKNHGYEGFNFNKWYDMLGYLHYMLGGLQSFYPENIEDLEKVGENRGLIQKNE